MALRSLGSSLVAKAGVGSRSRQIAEDAITQPNLPEKGVPGTVSRDQVQNPLERPVPPGTTKVVGSAPIVESASTAPPVDLDSLIPPAGVQPGARPGAEGQALFQGGITGSGGRPTPTSRAPQGVAGQVTGQTGGQANLATAYRPPPVTNDGMGLSVEAQGRPSQNVSFDRAPLTSNLVGGRVYADQPKTVPYTPTAGQYVAGGIGKVASAVGNAINNPTLRSVGNNLQSFGGQPTRSAQNTPVSRPGSITQTVSNVVNQLRSTVQSALNGLRSLFGR